MAKSNLRENGITWVDGKMTGETVEVKITLKRVEVWHNGAFIKRWKY